MLVFCGSCAGHLPRTSIPEVESYRQATRSSKHSTYLYVANSVKSVSIFALGSLKPLREIRRRADSGAMTFDSAGNLYVANEAIDYGSITVYGSGTGKRLRSIHDSGPTSIVLDAAGYLYVANYGPAVAVYAPNSTRVSHVIRKDVDGAVALAFDKKNNLYVANVTGNSVTVYAPGKRAGDPQLTKKISGLRRPRALAFGPDGDLFVIVNDGVNVYKGGSLELKRQIRGVRAPMALAVSASGMLYVSSSPVTRKGYQKGWVTAYPSNSGRPVAKITDGIDVPAALGIGPYDDDLYVANERGASVTVYSPHDVKLIRKIVQGISVPSFVAFGPN
jgi:sugar lactone lactonase YvrE